MESKNLSNYKLNDEHLEKVDGGKTDWILFSKKLLALANEGKITLTADHKKIIEAIKTKKEPEIEAIAIPIIANDSALAIIALECEI